jgi:hypothetical protein
VEFWGLGFGPTRIYLFIYLFIYFFPLFLLSQKHRKPFSKENKDGRMNMYK